MINIDEAIISLVNKYNGWGLCLFTVIAVLASGLLSTLIGIEREMKGQAAGLRTHVIVSIGCALLMVISVFGIQLAVKAISSPVAGENYNLNFDVSRVAAGILSGIGFMGAGAIVKNGLTIRGLTTASTLWLTAAIGMACGCGFILEAVVVTLIAMALLIGLSQLERHLDKGSPQVHLVVAPNIPILSEIRAQAEKHHLYIKNIKTDNSKSIEGNERLEVTVYFAYHTDQALLSDFIESFSSYPYVFKAFVGKDRKQKKNTTAD